MSGGLERRASRRWRSSPRAYLRKKQLRRAINFLPSLNGATDEGAPRRSRPSRLGRARAARGGETPRARLRARGRFESRAEPRSREDAYRLALRTDTVDYSPPREMERMLRLAFARRNLGRRALDPANHASSPVVQPRRVPTTRSLESPGRASLWRARVLTLSLTLARSLARARALSLLETRTISFTHTNIGAGTSAWRRR